MEAFVWLGLAIALFVIEIVTRIIENAAQIDTLGLNTIWFAGGAFVAGIAALFHTEFQFQMIIFLAISLLLRKYVNV